MSRGLPFIVTSFPGAPIPAWRKVEKERLVHTVVRMHLISNQLLRKRHGKTIFNELGFMTFVDGAQSDLRAFVRNPVRWLEAGSIRR